MLRYRIPTSGAERLVRSGDLVVLLDGLDEVMADSREACIDAINGFRSTFGTTRVVVCCRSQDFRTVGDALEHAVRIVIDPLRREHVDRFLELAGPPLAGLRAALMADDDLRELLRTPLMLSVAALAYSGTTVDPAPDVSEPAVRQDRLWEAYVRRMLDRRTDPRYGAEQMVRQLSFVAIAMQRVGLIQFQWEQIVTPTAMGTPCERTQATARRLSVCCAAVAAGLPAVVLVGPAAGVVIGLFVAIPALAGYGWDVEAVARLSSDRRSSSRSVCAWAAAVGYVALHSLFAGAVFLVAKAVWPPRLELRFILLVPDGVRTLASPVGPAYAAAIATFVFAAIQSDDGWWRVRYGPVRRQRRELPGPWMRVVMRAGAVLTLIVACSSVVSVAGVAYYVSWAAAVRLGLAGATSVVVLGFSILGGAAVVEQVLLRRQLDRAGTLVVPVRPLLDHATHCLLLRMVGDEHMFVHRSSQEWFARRSSVVTPTNQAGRSSRLAP